jgi:hypothetical protein
MSNPQYNPTGAEEIVGQPRSVRTHKCTPTQAQDGFWHCHHSGCTKRYSRYNAFMKHLDSPHADNKIIGPLLLVPRTATNDLGDWLAPAQQNSVFHGPAVTSSSPALNGEAFTWPAGPLQGQSATLTATVLAEEEHREPGFVLEGVPAHCDDEMPSANEPESVTDLVQRLMGHSSLATYITQILWCMLMDNDYWARYCALTLQDHQWNTVAVRNLWPEPLPPDLECLISGLRISPNWPAIQRKFLQDHKGRQTPYYCWLHQLTLLPR